VHATGLSASPVRAPPRDGQRGRPRAEARPAQVVYPIDGALAAALTARQAHIDQHRGGLVATTAFDTTPRPPHAVWEGSNGQVHAARGCRCVHDPQVFASSLDRPKPARLMALLLVMRGCVVVYAALADRLRQARNDHAATFPHQPGKRRQQPTARWVCHDVVGSHWRCPAGQWPIVLHLTAAHQPWLRRLGQPSLGRYDVQYA
jgi:hypothetical protein